MRWEVHVARKKEEKCVQNFSPKTLREETA